MPINGYFDEPFANSGVKTTVPDAVQSNGSVSYSQGYGIDYTLPNTNPNYRYVEPDKFNQIIYDITSAIQSVQQGLPAPFITSTMNGGSPFSYAQYASVTYNGIGYISLVSANTDTPPSSKWAQISLNANQLFTGGVTTGSANAQVLSSLSPSTGFSYSNNGQIVFCTPGYSNTGACFINVTGLGSIEIYKPSGGSFIPLTGGEIVASDPIYLTVNTSISGLVLSSTLALGTMSNESLTTSIVDNGSGGAVKADYSNSIAGTNETYSIATWGNFVLRSNSGTAMVDTLPGTGAPLANGWNCIVKNTDASASLTINVGSGGTLNIGTTTGSPIVSPGEIWYLESEGAGVYNAARVSSAVLHSAPPSSAHKNLYGVFQSNTNANFTADAIVVQDSNNNTRRVLGVNVTLNTASMGANGLDTGSIAANTWYAIYIIANYTTNTVACLMSASFSSPTLPSGYTYASGPISVVRTNGSSQLIGFYQRGTKWQYSVGSNLTGLPQLASGAAGSITTPTYVAIPLGSFLPTSIAASIYFTCFYGTSSTAILVAQNANYGAEFSTSNPAPYAVGGGTNTLNTQGSLLLESSSIYWANDGSGNALYITGFELNI